MKWGFLLESTLLVDGDEKNKLPFLKEIHNILLLLNDFLSNWISFTSGDNQILPMS